MTEPKIHYRVCPARPQAHLFSVELTVVDPDPAGQRLSLPAWIPGSYMIRDFAKNIVSLEARCGDDDVVLEAEDKQTWRAAPCKGPLKLRYEVYAWDLSVRSAHLDTTHGFFNGTSLYLRVHGREHEVCSVELLPPPGEAFADWRVATALAEDGAERYGFGRYRAGSFEELVDHPVEMGTFALAHFEACGVPHDIAITGRHDADMDRLCRDLKVICEAQIRFFGEPAPVERYVFLVMAVGDGYGGLEHRASTALLCSRADLPRKELGKPDEGYTRFLGLCSHEYFHTWNVKRIQPAAYQGLPLDAEAYTRLLWAFEGITSYYDDLFLRRAGLVDDAGYLELLGQVATRVMRGQGRRKQTVSDSSFYTWTKFYKQDENGPNAIVSYYTKGALVALCLDLLIRRHSEGARSLDDLMRQLWREFGQPGRGVQEGDVERLASEVAGVDLADFFARALRSTAELPLPELLAEVGVRWQTRAAASGQDMGGKPQDKLPRSTLGARVKTTDTGEAELQMVFEGGAAQVAGLAPGDRIIAVDGLRVGGRELEQRIGSMAAGRTVDVHAFRRDELMRFEVCLQAPPEDTVVLSAENGSAQVNARRESWLGGAGS